jgi:hypothetical protein
MKLGLCVCVALSIIRSTIIWLRVSSFFRSHVIVIRVLLNWRWERGTSGIILTGETRSMEDSNGPAFRRASVEIPIGCGCARKWWLFVVIITRKTYIWIHFVDSSSEVWSKSDENTLAIWKRKIEWKLFSPVNENGEWQVRTNQEMMDLYRE